MQQDQEYIQFGEEWRKDMMKFSISDITNRWQVSKLKGEYKKRFD